VSNLMLHDAHERFARRVTTLNGADDCDICRYPHHEA